MAVPQAKFRELVFQILYSQTLGGPAADDMVPLMMKELSVTKKTVRQALDRVASILRERDALDRQLEEISIAYSFDRIREVEKGILRLGAYEILIDDAIPPKVAIAEAVRLARKFSTPEAGAFVNALLDAIYRKTTGEELDPKALETSAEALQETEELGRLAGEESVSAEGEAE